MTRPSPFRVLGRTLLLGVGLIVAYYVSCALVLLGLNVVGPPVTGVQVQRWIEAVVEGSEYDMQRSTRPRERISPHLAHAVVAAEDGRFYEHEGIDWEAIRQAVEDNQRRNRPRGGSTITQQLVKNLFLTTHSTIWRKAIELPLALMADRLLPKERILELYLNHVEWGPGVFGAEAAARHHYGISSDKLSRDQSARLAACLPAPRSRSPQRMSSYGSIIRRRMSQMGW